MLRSTLGSFALPFVSLLLLFLTIVLKPQFRSRPFAALRFSLLNAALFLNVLLSTFLLTHKGALYLSMHILIIVVVLLGVSATVLRIVHRQPFGWLEYREFSLLVMFGLVCFVAFTSFDLASYMFMVKPQMLALGAFGGFVMQLCLLAALIIVEQRMQNAALEKFSLRATQVAHDIRSPCTALQLAATKLAESEQSAWSDIIRRSSERITAIAGDLVTAAVGSQGPVVARISADEQTFCDLDQELRALVLVKQIEFNLDSHLRLISPGKIPIADISSRQRSELLRVLCNLINNAFEARGQNGFSEIRLVLSVEHGSLHCAVVDNGLGVSPAQAVHVARSQRFSSKKVGLGLGLVSARRLALSLGGTFTLRTDADGWTRATLKVPVLMSCDGYLLSAKPASSGMANVDVISLR